MLFAITTWIIALTVIGILAVCVFRAVCEPEVDPNKNYEAKRKLETNHYEPLNHELKKIEANAAEASAAEKKDPVEEKSVVEPLLVDVKTVEPVVSEEKKPLNTQSVDNPETLQEVRVTNGAAEPSAVSTVVIETQHSQQTLVRSAGVVVNATKTEEISSPPPIVKVSNVSATTAAPISEPVVEQKAVLETPQEPPAPLADVIVPEQPNNNEIPTPYNEVESATLPKLNGPNEPAVKTSVLPA